MSPYDRAAALYSSEQAFLADLYAHLTHGYVLSTPRVFAMFRPVQSDWTPERINDLTVTAPDGDGWLIWCLAGDPLEMMGILTQKKFIAYAREGVLSWRNHDRLRRLYVATAARKA